MLYASFWVIPRRLNFIWRRFGTLCLFHLHRQVGACWILHAPTCLWKWKRQIVPKCQHIKFRRWGITKKKAHNIQNTAKVWNQELYIISTATWIQVLNYQSNNIDEFFIRALKQTFFYEITERINSLQIRYKSQILLTITCKNLISL